MNDAVVDDGGVDDDVAFEGSAGAVDHIVLEFFDHTALEM